MLGFEHPSHMVTHPSTDEAQCCLSLEIFVNSAKKKEERKKMKTGSRVPSELRGLKKCTHYFNYLCQIVISIKIQTPQKTNCKIDSLSFLSSTCMTMPFFNS